MAVWDVLFWVGRRSLYRTALAIMDVCKDDLMELASIGELLPYLQHLPAKRLASDSFVAFMWALPQKEVDEIARQAEDVLQAQDAVENNPTPSTRFPRRYTESDAGSVCKPRTNDQSFGVLRRVIGSITTPLRTPLRTHRDSAVKHSARHATPQHNFSPHLESLQEALSPSFGRSGLLSPSFRGDMQILLSPRAISHLDIASTNSLYGWMRPRMHSRRRLYYKLPNIIYSISLIFLLLLQLSGLF